MRVETLEDHFDELDRLAEGLDPVEITKADRTHYTKMIYLAALEAEQKSLANSKPTDECVRNVLVYFRGSVRFSGLHQAAAYLRESFVPRVGFRAAGAYGLMLTGIIPVMRALYLESGSRLLEGLTAGLMAFLVVVLGAFLVRSIIRVFEIANTIMNAVDDLLISARPMRIPWVAPNFDVVFDGDYSNGPRFNVLPRQIEEQLVKVVSHPGWAASTGFLLLFLIRFLLAPPMLSTLNGVLFGAGVVLIVAVGSWTVRGCVLVFDMLGKALIPLEELILRSSV